MDTQMSQALRLLGVLSKSSHTGEEDTDSWDFPTQPLPHSFKQSSSLFPIQPFDLPGLFCRMGLREHLIRSSAGRAASSRGAASTPLIKYSGPRRKYLFVASTESEPSLHNILVLTKNQ